MTSTDEPAPRPSAIVLDHVTVTVSDLTAGQHFYDAALEPLGILRAADYLDPEDEDEVGTEAVGYAGGDDRVVLWLVVGSLPTTGLHLAFRADDQAAVQNFFSAGCAAGGSAHTSPRPWQVYRPGIFSAMIADPAGNLIEAVCG
ncbi:MAG: lactoylglutathione lyase protein [Pseudonocardiales bacterium]|nr:lactoylglutathione lyase protein [Pseudonocardiales bacterium]